LVDLKQILTLIVKLKLSANSNSELLLGRRVLHKSNSKPQINQPKLNPSCLLP